MGVLLLLGLLGYRGPRVELGVLLPLGLLGHRSHRGRSRSRCSRRCRSCARHQRRMRRQAPACGHCGEARGEGERTGASSARSLLRRLVVAVRAAFPCHHHDGVGVVGGATRPLLGGAHGGGGSPAGVRRCQQARALPRRTITHPSRSAAPLPRARPPLSPRRWRCKRAGPASDGRAPRPPRGPSAPPPSPPGHGRATRTNAARRRVPRRRRASAHGSSREREERSRGRGLRARRVALARAPRARAARRWERARSLSPSLE